MGLSLTQSGPMYLSEEQNVLQRPLDCSIIFLTLVEDAKIVKIPKSFFGHSSVATCRFTSNKHQNVSILGAVIMPAIDFLVTTIMRRMIAAF